MHALDALGSPIRREILAQLRDKPQAVVELAAHFPISRPAISKHLRLLQQAGLVEAHTHGTRSVYTVRLEGFASVRDFVDAFWDAALQRLAALARDDVARKDHS